jgi:hypothetical protein
MKAKAIGSAVLALAVLVGVRAYAQGAPVAAEVGKPLPAWSEGGLDIHHINTGRGDGSLLILPDGTSLLEDFSGRTVEEPPFSLPTKPDTSRPAGRVGGAPRAARVARVRQADRLRDDFPSAWRPHGDDRGGLPAFGTRRLPVERHYPGRRAPAHRHGHRSPLADYDYPAPIKNRTVENYRKFLAWQIARRGLKVEQFLPGRNDQITLLHEPKAYPEFEIRNLMVNGVVWTGEGTNTHNLFRR